MRLAFDAIGGRCVATCEWNKYARKTYAANFPIGSHPFYENICEVTKDDELIRAIPDHDILVAGFPCQPFSIAGVSKKNSLGNAHGFACETQGTLFFELVKIIKIKKPKAFLLEIVNNLESHDKGNTFRVIMDVLRNQLGYWVDYKVLDAKGFVPQHRERTIIVGFQQDAGFSWEDVRIPASSAGPRMGSMADIVSRNVRSRMMAGIRGKDTKPELLIRSDLHGQGFRFRLHVSTLPGRPDIALPKWNAVILVHGCFWHAHRCHLFKLPSTRRAWWREKLLRNRLADKRTRRALEKAGWRVLEIYECSLKGRERLPGNEISQRVASWVRDRQQSASIRGRVPSRKS